MQSWKWMLVRAFAPAMELLLLAGVLPWVAYRAKDALYVSAFVPALRWVIGGSLLAALGASVIAAIALWRWQAGYTYVCACGGLLGFEHDGRWGPYKRCLACSRNVARCHYAPE